MRARHLKLLSEFFEGQGMIRSLNQAAHASHVRGALLFERHPVGLTSLTGTKTCPFRIGTASIKPNIFPFREAARARRPAIHTSCFDRIVKHPVGGPIPLRYEFPIIFAPGERGG